MPIHKISVIFFNLISTSAPMQYLKQNTNWILNFLSTQKKFVPANVQIEEIVPSPMTSPLETPDHAYLVISDDKHSIRAKLLNEAIRKIESTQSHLSVEQLKYGFMSLIDYSIGLTEEQTMLILYIKEVNYLGGEEIDCFISERKSIEDTDAYQKCFKIFLITQNLEHFINPPASEMAILKKIPGWNEAETSQSSEQTIKEDKVDDGVQESTNSKEPSQCSQYEVIDMEEESNSDEEMHRNNDVHHERKCTKDDSQAQKLPCNTQAPPAQFNHLYNESPKNSEWAYAPQKLEDNSNTSSSDAGKQAESESSFLSEKVVVGPLYEEREYSDRFLSSPEEGGTSSEWYKNEWLQNNGSKKMNRLKKKYSKEIETKKPRVSTTDDIVRKKTRDSKDSSTTETEKTTRKKRTNKFGYQYLLDAILSVIKRSKKM